MNETATPTQTRKPLVGIQRGTVTSDKRDQTAKVIVSFLSKDQKYGKYVKHRSVFHVHDPQNLAKMGDIVEIAPCRRISKTKSWRLVRVVETAADRAHD